MDEIKSVAPIRKDPVLCMFCCYFNRTADEGGECRISPPKFVIIPGKLAGQQEVRSIFPPVAQNMWCGEGVSNE